MTRAVENARFGVRQKLIDLYTNRAEQSFVKMQETVIQTRLESLEAEFADSTPATEDYSLLSGFKCVLAYDAAGTMEWPRVEYPDPPQSPELAAILQSELDGDFEAALTRYDAIASETPDAMIRHAAFVAKARCLVRLDRTAEAMELLYGLAYPTDIEGIAPALVPAVLRDRVFVALLYEQTADERLLVHLRRILAGGRYADEEENPFLPWAPTETLIWQLEEFITIAERAGLADSLREDIALAQRRIDACTHAVEIAGVYPSAESLSDWPDRTIRRIAADSQQYGLKFKLSDKTLLGVFTTEEMLNVLTAVVDDMQDDTIGVKVYDNFGVLFGGDEELASKPFLTLAPGKFLPDFRVDLCFRDDSVFKDAAGKETAGYVWTGTLVVALIVTSGAVAARAVGQQIRLNRLKNDFIATVTHELKTPLSSMRVLVDTLLEGRYEDRVQAVEYLQLISRENLRLTRLIDNFLTFSRMDRNKRAFEIVKTSAAEIAKAAVEAMQTKLNGGRCRLSVSIQESLPSVVADKDAMVTVLVNLLDNAYKYTRDDKQIELKVCEKRNVVCFSVADNGIGMTARQMKRIFDRFYQADASLSRRAEGAGLGLSIVKFICDAHHARITVDSRPGEGSTFTVELPAAYP
jgi:signal transduction histidine kinase